MSIVTHLGQNLNWTAYKAGHNSFTITFTNGGSAFDISTYTFVVNITKIGDTTNVLQLTEASGITNGGAAGTLAIALTQTQATTTLPGSDYWYEIAYTKDSKVYALLQGTLQLSNKKNPESTTTSVSASVSLAGSSVSAAVTLGGGSVTSSGIATALGAQAANTIYAGPSSGAAANPSFRAIGKDDIGFLSKFYYVGASNGSNDKTAIDAAVALAKANGGGAVIFNPGRYYVTATLEYTDLRNVWFIGNGTIINSNFLAGDVLYIYPTVTPVNDGTQDQGIQGLKISGFHFESSVRKTSGAAIHVKYSEHAVIENIRIGTLITATGAGIGTAKFYDGIFMEYAAAMNLSQLNVNFSHVGLKVSGNLAGGFWAYFNYDGTLHGNCEFWGDRTAGSIGIQIGGGCGGLRIEDGNIVWVETAIKIDMTLYATTNREIFIGHFFLDSTDGYGLDVAANSVNILKIDNGWIAGTGRGTEGLTGYPYGAGINIAAQATASHVFIDGLYMYDCSGSGIQSSGGMLTVTSSWINSVGTGTNGGDGITVLGATQNNVTIVGNNLKTIGKTTKGAGIRLVSTVTRYQISGNLIDAAAEVAYSGPSPVHNGPSFWFDNFNQANLTDLRSTLIHWEKFGTASTGTIGISSNAAKLTSLVTTSAKYVINTGLLNVDVRAVIGVASGNLYLILSNNADDTYLQIRLSDCEIKQLVAGVATTLFAGAGASVSGDEVKVVRSRSTVTAYRNGVSVGSSSSVSASLTATKHGIFIFNDITATIDEFSLRPAP